jgi:protoporphyrinogen oxidase
MIRRVAGALPGIRKSGAGRFFYPKKGFGQISDVFHRAAESSGAQVLLKTTVTAVSVEGARVCGVEVQTDGERRMLPATYVLSTIPLTVLARLVRSDESPVPATATAALQQRSMVLVYLTLDTDQFTEFDAHYFPEASIRITRLSEPKNYSLTDRPGRTVLCAELPCTLGDPEWSMSEADLGALVCRDLEQAGLAPVPRVLSVNVERLPYAYPLYTQGYRQAFEDIDRWLGGIEGLVTFGRQGLFVHDNTHHTMAMAYALVECIGHDGVFDRSRWAEARRGFEKNVVED